MSTLSDRALMTIIVVTGVAGLVGFWAGIGSGVRPGWFTAYTLPIIGAVGLVVLVAIVWVGLSRMD